MSIFKSAIVLALVLASTTVSLADDNYFQQWVDIGVTPFNQVKSAELIQETFDLPVLGLDANGKEIHGHIVNWSITFKVTAPAPVAPSTKQLGVGIIVNAPNALANVNPIFDVTSSPPPSYVIANPQGINYVWVPTQSQVYTITVSGKMDLTKVDWNQTGTVIDYLISEGVDIVTGPGGPGGTGDPTIVASAFSGGMSRWKPGTPIPTVPDPAYEPPNNDLKSSGSGCSSCGCADGPASEEKRNNGGGYSSNRSISAMLQPERVMDTGDAEVPSICPSCGAQVEGGTVARSYVQRYFTPINLFHPSSTGRGSFINYDYALMFRNQGDAVALLYDPQRAKVYKFGQQSVEQPTGNGTTTLVPTELFEPEDHDHFESFSVLDDLGAAVTDPIGECETGTVYAVLKRRNGYEYKFRLINRFDSRLEEIKSPHGEVTSITYRADYPQPIGFTNAEIQESPTRVKQIYQVTGPDGDVATFNYHGAKKNGRWALSGIQYASGQELEYQYDTDGYLSEVKRKRNSNANLVTLSKYVYTTNTNDPNATIEKQHWNGRFFVTKRILVASDYRVAAESATDGVTDKTWADDNEFGGLADPDAATSIELVNQVGGALIAINNGLGQREMTVYRSSSESLMRVVSNGSLVEWSPGKSVRYGQTMPGNPGDFGLGDIEDDSVPGITYANHPGVSASQILTNTPAVTRDMYGRILNHEYDTSSNLTKTIYDQGETYETYESWTWNANNRLEKYRDREGRITLYQRDASQRLTAIIRGLLDDGNGGYIAGAGAIQTRFGYNANGYLAWKGTAPYPGGDPATDYRTSYTYDANNRISEVKKPAIQTDFGVLQRPTIQFVWTADQLDSMTDEKGNQTTFDYDDYGRLVRTNYSDGTKTETWYDDANSKIYSMNRVGAVTMQRWDDAGRSQYVYQNFGHDSGTILDGQIQTLHSNSDRTITNYYYYAGWTTPYGIETNERFQRSYTDYRGRTYNSTSYPGAQRYERRITSFFGNRPFKVYETTSQFVGGVQNTSSTYTYNGYSAQNQLVRTVRCRDNVSYTDNDQILNLVRPTVDTPDIEINDAIKDLSGNVVELIGPDGVKTMAGFDDTGRQVSQTRAFGTSVASTSTTEYDSYGRQSASVAPSGIRNEILYDPSGNAVEHKVVPTGGLPAQVTSMTYTIKGEPKKTKANDNTITEQFYSQCCGHTRGTRNALGHGAISNSDSAGRTVHSVSVGNFDSQWLNPLNPATANTYSESTTRYGVDGQVQFTTRWLQDPGLIDVNNPPIAGVGSIASTNGITTQYVYDNDLGDGIGLDIAAGKAITPIHAGTASTINITAAITKLAEVEANGGIELVPGIYDPLRATVVISPDEKTMRVSISNQSGSASMSAVMSGPAATSPSQLIDWSCRRAGLRQNNVTGHTYAIATRTVYPDGTTTSSITNGLGQAVGSLDQDGNLTRQVYNAAGQLVKTIDALSNETTFVYDDLGRRISTTNALQQTSSVTYDSAGRQATVTDAKGGVTTHHYDGYGRVVKITDRLGKDTDRTYDDMNRLSTIVDTENKATSYQYDALGRRTKITLADGAETNYVYDATGRQIEITKPSGIKRKPIYAAYSGELDKVEYYDAGNAIAGTDDFSYDNYLRRTGSTSRDGVILAKTYNERGQLATDSTTYSGKTYTVSMSYDDRGRLIELTYPSGRKAAYAHDNRSLLSTISWESTQIEDRSYDAIGRLTTVNRPVGTGNPLVETRAYDAVGRVTLIGNTNVGDASYTYDANGNKQSENWTGVMAGWDFTTINTGTYSSGYDDEDRLRNFVQPSKSVDLFLDRSNIGNITNYKQGTTDAFRSYSDSHELTTIDGATQSFDVDGNLTESHTGIELNWDEAGMLDETVVSAGDTAGIEGTNEYGYDASQKRTWKKITRNGSVAEHTVFIYAGPNCIAEYASGTAAGSPAQEYVYAQGIDALAMIVRSGGSQKLTVTRNQQWSISALADLSDGTVLERYTYDAFGKRTILAADGATVRTVSSYNNPYGYTSRRHDDESGLMYFRARYYDPATGEFCSQDPLEYVDGMSLYRAYFVPGGMDPTGQNWVWPWDENASWTPAIGEAAGDGFNTGLDTSSNFFGGWADTLTFGGTENLRDYWGQGGFVDTNSGVYTAGGYTGAGVAVAAGGAAVWQAAGGATFGAGVVTTSETSVVFTVNGSTFLGTSSGLVNVPAGYYTLGYWTSISGVPILSGEAAIAGAGGSLWISNHPCASRALQAVANGWWPF